MISILYAKVVIVLSNRRGQTLAEYGLILALVSVVVIAVLISLGEQLQNIFNTVTTSMNAIPSVSAS